MLLTIIAAAIPDFDNDLRFVREIQEQVTQKLGEAGRTHSAVHGVRMPWNGAELAKKAADFDYLKVF
jgi:hypothetical protein